MLKPAKSYNRKTVSLFVIAVVCAISAKSSAQVLVDRYSFNDGTANDSVGTRNGTLIGSATVSGGLLNLPGGSVRANYLSLPVGSVITGNTSLTLEAWFSASADQIDSKIWMFGASSSGSYLDYSPDHFANGGGSVEITTSGQPEQSARGGGVPALNVEHQVVGIYDFASSTVSYYLDGAFVASGTETVFPSSFPSSPNNYLGASLATYGDLDFKGSIDEFRIYGGTLDATQVAHEFTAGPNVASLPEPTTCFMVLGSLGIFAGFRRRRGSRKL